MLNSVSSSLPLSKGCEVLAQTLQPSNPVLVFLETSLEALVISLAYKKTVITPRLLSMSLETPAISLAYKKTVITPSLEILGLWQETGTNVNYNKGGSYYLCHSGNYKGYCSIVSRFSKVFYRVLFRCDFHFFPFQQALVRIPQRNTTYRRYNYAYVYEEIIIRAWHAQLWRLRSPEICPLSAGGLRKLVVQFEGLHNGIQESWNSFSNICLVSAYGEWFQIFLSIFFFFGILIFLTILTFMIIFYVKLRF